MASTFTLAIRKCADTLMSGVGQMKDTWLTDETNTDRYAICTMRCGKMKSSHASV